MNNNNNTVNTMKSLFFVLLGPVLLISCFKANQINVPVKHGNTREPAVVMVYKNHAKPRG